MPRRSPPRFGQPRSVRIELLGGLRVVADGQPVGDAAWRLTNARTLVKLLALSGPSYSMHRDLVLEFLWPDAPPRMGDGGLHQVLYCARRALDPAQRGAAGPRLVGDLVTLATEGAELWVDVDAFEAAARSARASGDVEDLDRAIALYTGELLPEDRYADWASARRTSLQAEFTNLLVERARRYVSAGALGDAVGVLDRALAIDTLHEDATLELMRANAALGRLPTAVRAYEQFRTTLLDELGVEPSSEATRLYDEFRASTIAPRDRQGSIRCALPSPATGLVGRRRELAAAAELLRRSEVRVVTFRGPGGTGKTRLAIEVAAMLAPSFGGRAAFVDLAPLAEPTQILPTIARELQLDDDGRGVANALADTLSSESILLVLDNMEHLLGGAWAIADLVARCPGLKVLTTSRAALRIRGEWELTIPPLELPERRADGTAAELAASEAVQLFVERARAIRPDAVQSDADLMAVGELCRRLDGLPLAIELAAARMRIFTPVELLDRLDRRLPIPSGGAQDLPARHQTLPRAVAWSYDLLDAAERSAFRRLGVFAGGWALPGAEALLGPDAAPLLESLASKSLIVVETGPSRRFRMLETIREYAVERLAASGDEPAARDAHLTHVRDLVVEIDHWTGQADGPSLALIQAELANIHAALAWCRDGRTDAADGLALVHGLRHVWVLRGLVEEGRAWAELFLRRSTEATPTYAATRIVAGELAWAAADYPSARRHGEMARDLFIELGDDRGAVRALTLVAFAEVYSGNVAAARSVASTAIVAARASGDDGELARAELGLGLATLFEAWRDGASPCAAVEPIVRSLEICRRIGNKRTARHALSALASLHLSAGEPTLARPLLVEGIGITLELSDRWAAPWQLENAALLAADDGSPAVALRLLGSVDAYRASVRIPRPPVWAWAPLLDARRRDILAALPNHDAERSLAGGRALSLDAALREVLAWLSAA